MTIKNLHPTQQNFLLGLTLCTAMLFTSCSRSLTSMNNTSKLQNQQVLAKPSHETSLATAYQKEKGIDVSTDKAIPLSAQSIDITPAQMGKKENSGTLAGNAHKYIHHASLVKNLIVNKIDHQIASIQAMPKNSSVMSAKNTAQPERNMVWTGFYFLIISLVFFILSLLPVIGIVFWYIAIVFLVVGLLFLLLGLLRMAE